MRFERGLIIIYLGIRNLYLPEDRGSQKCLRTWYQNGLDASVHFLTSEKGF